HLRKVVTISLDGGWREFAEISGPLRVIQDDRLVQFVDFHHHAWPPFYHRCNLGTACQCDATARPSRRFAAPAGPISNRRNMGRPSARVFPRVFSASRPAALQTPPRSLS